MGRHETYFEEDIPAMLKFIEEKYGGLGFKEILQAHKDDPRILHPKTIERRYGSLKNIRFLPDQVNNKEN